LSQGAPRPDGTSGIRQPATDPVAAGSAFDVPANSAACTAYRSAPKTRRPTWPGRPTPRLEYTCSMNGNRVAGASARKSASA